MLSENYYDVINEILGKVRVAQKDNVRQAGEFIAEAIMSGGILQAFGSGHSAGTALEICGRAGGLIPAKQIKEPAEGIYEQVEGVGTIFANKVDIRENDVVFIISNSGRNPMIIELAEKVKEVGAKLIVITALEVSKGLTSRHSNGKMLFEYADIVLDNMGVPGDCYLEVEGLPVKVGGTSSIVGAMMANCSVLESIEIMLSKGYTPPIFMSANVDGGPEFNRGLLAQYSDRLNRI